MNTAFPAHRATALVIVLAFIVLLAAVVVGLLSSVGTDLASSKSYAAGVSVRQLADTAVNVVQGQISDATKSFEVPASPAAGTAGSGARLTWSSQPGLIRTYSETGAPHRSFKLFSALNMVENPGVDYIPTQARKTEVPDDWPSKPGLYTDLNFPVLVADPAGNIVSKTDSKRYSANYPILDPLALNRIEGFKLNLGTPSATPALDPELVPGYGGPTSISDSYDPTATPAKAGKTGNPAPMPVTWIYVLKNGKLTVPKAATTDGGGVYWDTGAPESDRPTESNPIVGRIAFWTDDETSKLNINTASEGTFWGRAWGNSDISGSPYGERQLTENVPVRGEYQRYPGHPAMTCLSPVFGASAKGLLSLIPQMQTPTGDMLSTSDYDTILKRYYDITPRVGQGGTKGGTLNSFLAGAANPDVAMIRDTNRLYASLDELVFAAPDGNDSKGNPPANQLRNVAVNTGNTLIKRPDLEKAKFFLTAYNRAPDVNVFGRPRISMWNLQQTPDPNANQPNDSGANRPPKVPSRPRNPTDELLAYCATVNGFPFYFQRYSIYMGDKVNNRSASGRTKGPNGLPIAFMQQPSYGHALPSSQSKDLDWQITRNQNLYGYLQTLTQANIPGWGRSFITKYPTKQCDQILTEMIDLIRSGTNCYAQDSSPVPSAALPDVRYEYAPARRMPDAVTGETQIVPLVLPNGTHGFGRFPTITEAVLIFYATEVTASKASKMRILLVLQPFSPTSGSWTWSPLARYVVKGLNQISINGKPVQFGPSAAPGASLTNLLTARCGYGSGGNHNTAHTGTYAAFRLWNSSHQLGNDGTLDWTKQVPPSGFAAYDEELNYPFVSNEIAVDPAVNKGHFDFRMSGPLTVEVHSGYTNVADGNSLVQTLAFSFPPPTNGWPLPRDSGADKDFNNRIGPSKFNLVNAADTVRSVQVDPAGPSKGDLRLIAGLGTVPSNFFAPYSGGADGPSYNDPDATAVHSLQNGNGQVNYGKIHADLVDGTNGSPAKNTIDTVAARGLKGAKLLSGGFGDWDNGPMREWAGLQPDGALINKPDDYYSKAADGNDGWDGTPVTPNRQVHSPVLFGSLPVGVSATNPLPWQTLLFCANPAAGRTHPGFTAPRDHLFLDFFNMPVVEPYAISEPFSTAGRVNLNYEIAPFTYIVRNTAMRGVLKSTRVMAIPNSGSNSSGMRRAIDPDETLRAFDDRFRASSPPGSFTGDTGPFRTASEICDMYLVPTGATLAALKAGWWKSYTLTGDNAREFPYGHIYGRVTTKSNVFTVHMRVQSLRQIPPPGSGAIDHTAWYAEWREQPGTSATGTPRQRDQQLGEYRGSATIERYIDTGDPNLPDFADPKNSAKSMDEYYRFRIVSTKKFTP